MITIDKVTRLKYAVEVHYRKRRSLAMYTNDGTFLGWGAQVATIPKMDSVTKEELLALLADLPDRITVIGTTTSVGRIDYFKELVVYEIVPISETQLISKVTQRIRRGLGKLYFKGKTPSCEMMQMFMVGDIDANTLAKATAITCEV